MHPIMKLRRTFVSPMLNCDLIMKLRVEKRVEFVFLFGRDAAKHHSEAGEFNRKDLESEPLSHNTVCRLIKRFKETGPVAGYASYGRPTSATDEETSIIVLANVVKSPVKPVRRVRQKLNICKLSEHRILVAHKFHPNKMHLVQETLRGDHTDRRLKLCE